MNLIEKLQKAHDSMKSHETVTVELDWYEVAHLLALEKAENLYAKSLEDFLLGSIHKIEKKKDEDRIILYIDETDSDFSVKKEVLASDKRMYGEDIKFSINLADVKEIDYDKDNECRIFRLENTNNIKIINS